MRPILNGTAGVPPARGSKVRGPIRTLPNTRFRWKTAAQAERFYRRVVNACIRAQTQEEPVRCGQLNIAIVGAGATGTELARA